MYLNLIKSWRTVILSKLAVIVFVLLLPYFVLAQNNTSTGTVPAMPTKPTITKGVVTASINLSNAKIVEQTDSKFVIEFTLENRGDQPEFDIRYGVELIQNQEGGVQTISDSLIADEVLVLSPKQKVVKRLEYPLNGIAPGVYNIWVSAKTTAGTMLGLGNAGTLTIEKADVIEIKAGTCVLNVSGENKTYNLYQGVDVASGESLILDCTIKNHGEVEKTFVPYYETYRRTVFGEKVTMDYPAELAISATPYEEKNMILNIPIIKEPQAYDVIVGLKDEKTGEIISNQLVIHYVTQGVSATIQTVTLDKPYYASGDIISLEIFWTPSADSFMESRIGEGTDIGGNISAYTQVLDENNQACSEKVLRVMDKPIVSIKTKALTNCTKPSAEVLLIGPDGKTLDKRQIAVQDSVNPANSAEESKESQDKNGVTDLMTVSIIAFAIAFTTILFVVFRKKRTNTLV